VIFAEYDVAKAQDNLKLVTNLIDDPDVWNARIELVDRPDFKLEQVDLAGIAQKRLYLPPGLQHRQIDLKNRDIKITQAKNELFPQLTYRQPSRLNGGEDYGAAVGKSSFLACVILMSVLQVDLGDAVIRR